MKRIAILGSTGSIGRSTLSVAESYPERFEILTLAAGSNVDAAFEQAVRWKPRILSLADAQSERERIRGFLSLTHKARIKCAKGLPLAASVRSKWSTALPAR